MRRDFLGSAIRRNFFAEARELRRHGFQTRSIWVWQLRSVSFMRQSKSDSAAKSMADGYIGPYKIIRELAHLGPGQVFEAIDLLLKKRVAIKHLRTECSNHLEIEPRLHNEAERLGKLNHPHIARLFGFIRRDDQLYLVTEFIEGESLSALLKRKGRLEPNVAWAFFHEIVAAVGFAHRLGVIHGDLKPSNIIVTKLGVVKLLGFSLAPILRSAELAAGLQSSSICYTAPERLSGAPADARSDIYSLGVMLYEMLIGRAPLAGVSDQADEATIRAQSETTPLSPSLLIAGCPAWLEAFLLRALATSPADRFQSVSAMSQAIIAPLGATAEPGLSERIQAWLRRQIARWRSSGWDSLARTATRRARSVRTALAAGVTIGRKQASLVGRSLRHAFATPRQMSWAERPGRFPRRPIRRLGPAWLPASANRFFEVRKKIFASAAETGWKRYTVLALLLGAVMIEIFFFGGTNTLLRLDKPTAGRSYNTDVDQLFARIDSPSNADETQNTAAGQAPKVDHGREAPAKLDNSTSRAERDKARPKAVESVATDRPRQSSFVRTGPDRPNPRAAVREPRPSAADVSPRSAEKSNPGKIQLDVQWEN